ncbi:MAG: TPM domain-containing protein [archaeon]|nr:TPM domain-containing protein [archaeon]
MIMWKMKIGVLIFLLVLGATVAAQAVPLPQGYITDTANIIPPDQQGLLETRLKTLDEETGVEMVVLTIPTLEGGDIFEFTTRVFEAWKIGEAQKDTGLLIVIALQERSYFIETGYGLEGMLPDARLRQIAEGKMVPFFQEGDFAGGLEAGVITMEGYVRGDPDVIAQADSFSVAFPETERWSTVIALGLFAIILFKIWKNSAGDPQKKKMRAANVILYFFTGLLFFSIGGIFTALTLNVFHGALLTSLYFLYVALFQPLPTDLSHSGNSPSLGRGRGIGGGYIGSGFGRGGGGFGGGSTGGGGFGGRF